MIRTRSIWLGLAVAGGLAGAAWAHEAKLGQLTLKDLAVKASLNGVTTTGGYLTVVNAGAKPDRLVGASCACAEKVEIHRMWMEGSVMRMRKADDGLDVPAHGTLALTPSGSHLMLIRMKAPAKDKTDVVLTLTFAHAGKVTTKFHVKSDPGAPMAPMAGMR